MTKYRVRLKLRARHEAQSPHDDPRRRFWATIGLLKRSPDERRTPSEDEVDEDAINRNEYALIRALKAKLPSKLRRGGSRAELVGVEVAAYGSIDILLVFDQALNGAITSGLGTIVARCVAEAFDVPSNAMKARTMPEGEGADEKVEQPAARAVELGKKALPPLSVGAALILVGFLGASFLDRLSARWGKVDDQYAKLAEQQANMIKGLAERLTLKEDKREDVADNFAVRVFAVAQRMAVGKAAPMKFGPSLCELLKPVVEPIPVHVTAGPLGNASSEPTMEKVPSRRAPEATQASLKNQSPKQENSP